MKTCQGKSIKGKSAKVAKQLNFNGLAAFKDHIPRFEHGSGIRKGKRKLARPFDPKKYLHITLRSSKARGAWSFLKSCHERKIQVLIFFFAEKFDLKVCRYANSGNHLHLLIKARSKKGFQRYLRTITGLIPRIVTKAVKGKPTGKFWDELVYSKLICWGRQFKNTSNYIFKNALEGFGIISPRDETKGKLKLNYEQIFEG